ncbi:MAG: DUF192 domain-containing protein [Myxococcota bacterium]|nr:DUF192 domain-containing protein [Myxococcota bacterium]
MRFACVFLAFGMFAGCSAKREEAATKPSPPEAQTPVDESTKVIIETPAGLQTVSVEVVYTPPKIERGLMYREHLGIDAGMLFFMGGEADHTFYMRNTLIPLDMIFITKEMTIAGVVANAEPRTESLRSVGKPSLYVLEVNGGWAAAHQVAAGAKVRFEALPAALKRP